VVQIAVVGLPQPTAGVYAEELKALGHELVQLNSETQRKGGIPPVVLVGGVSAERIGRAILRRSPEAVIVLLVSNANVEAVRHGLAWGATAVIDIATPQQKVAATVAMLCDGGVVILPKSVSSILPHSSAAKSISPAQLECLRLLESDLTVAQMAQLAHRSKRSMQRDLSRLYRTLGVESRRGALEVAHDLGIFDEVAREPGP
jgi:DNA-binding NarL/FixJ family response regulator